MSERVPAPEDSATPEPGPQPGQGPAPDAGLDASGFWQRLRRDPHPFDLFFALRVLQARSRGHPRFGKALRPRDEPLRLGQDPSLAFAPATLAEVLPATAGQPERLTVWNFGLYGPNGPLPTHLTEYVRERLRQHDDPTIARFSDIFHHRLLLLFFRAWSDAQPVTSLDRPDNDLFGRHLRSLIGYGEASQRDRDTVPDHAKQYLAGHWTRWTRNPEGLVSALRIFFEVPVELVEFTLHYLELDPEQQTTLSRVPRNARLGVDTVVGSRVPDAQGKFRLRIGPLPIAQYERFLPGGEDFRALVDWVRNYVGIEFAWDYELILRREDVPPCQLGGSVRLGWTTWSFSGPAQRDPDDFRLDPELWLASRRRPREDAGAGSRAAPVPAAEAH
ncbi:type VI secretion system baseplate subunit TssG [Acidovorax sp. NCPPB 3859]|nr:MULTISPECIES: type VI secretion system baseplate subunit TssG [unclassified Acidovorax]MDA8452223.1 type VI secretion system baseplate subunit TssG [Acidovorax sp. GBBC 3297]MDA8461669.1 type VI secretion system baseplate subunit TssG [Acidovorax sp. GBBC 3333]MDA8466702.1 type VI secretion system baseplate subunit TssG [Acidovorax sp. GBBC 3332]MDA8471695.1 type VI secretion system baseplate subunit TssG [Acidovorax sp. GBBC 3299]WCM80175.1 type VI secretion system baseplate subunit TssG [